MGWISPLRLKLAATALRQGKLVAYPTEAVWGLGCDPFNPRAVADLIALKGRKAAKGLILIAADFEQIERFLEIGDAETKQRILATWPGPVTWVIPASTDVPSWLQGKRGSLAVRVTDHPVASALCRTFGGAIVSTSANPSGAPPARTQIKTRTYFKRWPMAYMPGTVGEMGKPTAIFDARSGRRLR